MVVLGLAVLPLVVGIDLALTRDVGPLTPDSDEDSVDLVTLDGRELGWAAPGLRLVHSPHTLYENLPNQKSDQGRINSIGLRAPEIAPVPDRPRVIVIGGSTAFGMGVNESNTLSSALSRQIGEAEILNAGVIGYQSSQELALVVHKLVDLQPSLFIAFDGWNDLFEAFWSERFGDAQTKNRHTNVIFNAIEERLLKYREVEWEPAYAMREAGLSIVRNSTLLSALYRSLAGARNEGERPLTRMTDQQVDTVADRYVSNMTKVSDLARARGGRLLVVLQPEQGQLLGSSELLERIREGGVWPGRWYWSAFPSSYLRFRNRVVEALSSAGVDVIDSTTLLGRTRGAATMFRDAVHLKPVGYVLIAELIRDNVRDALTPQSLPGLTPSR